MDKTFFFLSGLPRAGGTLLSALLNQHPDIHSGPDSPLAALMSWNLKVLDNNEQNLMYPKEGVDERIIKSVANAYYEDVSEQYIFDKCRVWSACGNVDMIRKYLNKDVKIVACVRDVVEVLASYLKLIHELPPNPDPIHATQDNFIDQQLFKDGSRNPNLSDDDNRCEWLMKENGLIQVALDALYQSKDQSFVHLVEYNDLVTNTQEVMDGIYDFLGIIPLTSHDLNNIVNPFKVNDEALGFPTLHDVRSSISVASIPPKDILSEYIINRYSGMEFWRPDFGSSAYNSQDGVCEDC